MSKFNKYEQNFSPEQESQSNFDPELADLSQAVECLNQVILRKYENINLSLENDNYDHNHDNKHNPDDNLDEYDHSQDNYKDDSDDYEEEDGYDYENDLDNHEQDDYEEEDTERLEFLESKMDIFRGPITKEILDRYPFIAELPPGVAIMGGVARSIAREMLAGEIEPIRDIDLVNIVNEEGQSLVDDNTLVELSKKYMPEDYAFGHGIGNDILPNYFATRDFTINQCLIKDQQLLISNYAINDFLENIIRPTYYEHRYIDQPIRSRLLMKALMMQTVLSQVTTSIPLIEDIDIAESSYNIYDFDIALNLNKAMSRNAETARAFTRNLVDWDLVPSQYADRPIEAAKYLRQYLYNFNFYPSGYKKSDDLPEQDDIAGFFVPDSMLKFHSSDPQIRQAMAEYEDHLTGKEPFVEERDYGTYSAEDYTYINSDD